MSDRSITVKEVENGFEVITMTEREKDADTGDIMYPEPKTFVAKTMEEALEMVEKKFKKVVNKNQKEMDV